MKSQRKVRRLPLASHIRVMRSRDAMPPWFGHEGSALAMLDGHITSLQRARGLLLALGHAVRAKAQGRHNKAALWLDLAAGLYRAKVKQLVQEHQP